MDVPAPCLSVVMPCFNEVTTVKSVIDAVLASPFTQEVIVVDDGSTDGTLDAIRGVADPRVVVVEQPCNAGKGAALRAGFARVTAPYVVVQDADLEYDPSEYEVLLRPLLDDRADVVFGSRFHTNRPHRVLYYWHALGNRVLTTASNMMTNLNLTDMETCYKAFRREVIETLQIEEDRFGFEPEITAKVAQAGWRVYEVGISYAGRTYAEGKKIGWRDGMRAAYCIGRYSRIGARLADRRRGGPAPADFADADEELTEVLHNLGSAENYTSWIFDRFEPYLGKRVLEIGAGHGFLTQRLVDGDREVVATDLSERCVDVLQREYGGRPNVTVRRADLNSAPTLGRFDSVVLVNVLEHVDDDVGGLRALAESLEPGGHILVWVPAFEALYSEFDARVGHVRRYTRKRLRRAALTAGLIPVDVRYMNSAGALGWWVLAKHLRRTPTDDWAVRFYDKGVIPLLRRVEDRTGTPLGQSVLGVLQRPPARP